MTDWIYIKDRLPDFNTPALFCNEYGNMHVSERDSHDTVEWGDAGYRPLLKLIAWMPLPEVPNGVMK